MKTKQPPKKALSGRAKLAIFGDNKYKSIQNGLLGGRPPVWATPEECEKDIEMFYQYTRQVGRSFTLSALATFMHIDRETLLNYSKNERYFGIIKQAKRLCQMDNEEGLHNGKHSNGYRFSLVNNHGWEDKKKLDIRTESISTILDDMLDDDLIEGEIVGDESLIVQ